MLFLNDFLILISWCSFCSFLIIFPSLINFLIIGELIWISFYGYGIFGAVSFDSLIFLIWSLFLLILAAGESAIGLSLIIIKFLFYNDTYFHNFANTNKQVFNLFLK